MKTLINLFGSKAGAATVATLLAGCGGGGCGSCIVPPHQAGATNNPLASPTPSPRGVTPAPSRTPTPKLTATPTPTAMPVIGCNQGVGSIPLGPALAPFALLAGTSIANVGNTNVGFATAATTLGIDDDLIGVFPGREITGFYPPGTDTDGPNAIYDDAVYNPDANVPRAAQNALTIAYLTVAEKASTATVAGDLSQASVPGHPTGTLPPGVYTSTSTLGISAGNLTLDGGGNPQSVFIFQMASTLTTSFNGGTSGNVILTGGANACNVYWQVGSSATLGGAAFSGNVLANDAVTINASTFNGRALARSAAVSIPLPGGSLITNPGGN